MSEMGKAPKLRVKRGSLSIVALCLFASAAIRIGSETGQALARETSFDDVGAQPGAPATTEACETPEDLRQVLDLFAKRDETLKIQEEEMQMRSVTLALAEETIDQKLAELVAIEESLKQTIAFASTAAEDDLSRLTSVYENMKPKDAAALFETMAPEFAAGFLGRMRPDSAAQIMAGLSPQAAYTISVVIAGRNAEAPTK
ncbi:hypothetical protein [Shimia sp. SDUM112013]|uniref:MotE family protein n=1 Tax=Shimia sp. SDUM112013 TaxID=3136160 RepID=UPI0032EBBEA8